MAIEKKDNDSPKLASALSEARSIIEAAEKRAEKVTAEAQKIFDDAEQKGYREGYKKGREDAARHAVRMISESTKVADSLAEEAARLAIAIAGTVISQHVAVEAQAAKHLAATAIQEAVVGDAVTLIVHPQDEGAIRDSIQDLRRIAGGASIAVETDSSFTRGGCLVRTEFGEVDATIEALLESVAERLGLM